MSIHSFISQNVPKHVLIIKIQNKNHRKSEINCK
jgi:hypothetical protein